MKKILIPVLLCITESTVFCQEAAKNIFAELGGVGGLSLNYDSRFTLKKNGIGGRIGFGKGIIIDGVRVFARNTSLLIPTQLNYLIGSEGKHYFEFGVGITFVTRPNNSNPYLEDIDVYDHTFCHLDVAYRHQPANGGFFYRFAYNPLFTDGRFIEPLNIGLSFGYTFKSSHK